MKDDDLLVQDEEKHPDNSLPEFGPYLPQPFSKVIHQGLSNWPLALHELDVGSDDLLVVGVPEKSHR